MCHFEHRRGLGALKAGIKLIPVPKILAGIINLLRIRQVGLHTITLSCGSGGRRLWLEARCSALLDAPLNFLPGRGLFFNELHVKNVPACCHGGAALIVGKRQIAM